MGIVARRENVALEEARALHRQRGLLAERGEEGPLGRREAPRLLEGEGDDAHHLAGGDEGHEGGRARAERVPHRRDRRPARVETVGDDAPACDLLRERFARRELALNAPHAHGLYTLKLDMVAQHVCWFEERGSQPLVLPFQVR